MDRKHPIWDVFDSKLMRLISTHALKCDVVINHRQVVKQTHLSTIWGAFRGGNVLF